MTTRARAELDITAVAAVEAALAALKPSLVINAAVVSSVEIAALQADRSFRVNAEGPGVLAQACAKADTPLIHISTDYVFGAPTTRAWREDDPVSAVNLYGRMKAEGEERVIATGARACVVRVAWLFGDGADFPTQMIRLGLSQGSVTVAEDQIGSPTPIRPLASLMLRLGQRLIDREQAVPSILHMAGSPPVARADWVAAVFEGLRAAGGEPPRLVRAPMARLASGVERPYYSALDTSLLGRLFGETLDWRSAAHEIGRRYSQGLG